MKRILKGFTLAEVMIVLTVIGVLAGILIPVANNSRPDEKVMKFKKAHATLANVIHELVTSDKYYAGGDLGVRPDGTIIDGTHAGDYTYFCNSFADVVAAKSVNCKDKLYYDYKVRYDIRPGLNDNNTLDSHCADAQSDYGGEIETSNGVVYFQISAIPFGTPVNTIHTNDNSNLTPQEICSQAADFAPDFCLKRLFGDVINDGFDVIYKVFCFDIDGINKGEDPFGYGIRADGKILTGARADEWLNKDFQKGKKDN